MFSGSLNLKSLSTECENALPLTCVVFEPDGIEVERWAEVKYVRVFALQKMWNTQFRPVMKTEYWLFKTSYAVISKLWISKRHASAHVRYVPLRLMPSIRSTFFIGVSRVPVKLMALALLTNMSIPVIRTMGNGKQIKTFVRDKNVHRLRRIDISDDVTHLQISPRLVPRLHLSASHHGRLRYMAVLSLLQLQLSYRQYLVMVLSHKT